MKRILTALGLVLTAAAIAFAGNTNYFTTNELVQFDGKDGRPMYLSVDGLVYDMTGVGAWSKGEHRGGKIGTDITARIKGAPHGKGVLSKRPVVGKLVPAFTAEELAQYDGKDGRPMYLSVDGLVYDMTGVGAWSKGEHRGGKIGTDITARIKGAPHGKGVLSKRPVVGKLVSETAKK